MDDVAHVHQAQPDAPADRRGDLREAEVEPGSFDGGLIGFDGALELPDLSALRVELLLGDDAGVPQSLISLEVYLGVIQLRLVAGKLALGLVQRRLVGARIDLDQQFAVGYVLAFFEVDRDNRAIHPRLDVDGVVGRHRTEAAQVDRHIAEMRLRRRHRFGAVRHARSLRRFLSRLGVFRVLVVSIPAIAQAAENQKPDPPPVPAPFGSRRKGSTHSGLSIRILFRR